MLGLGRPALLTKKMNHFVAPCSQDEFHLHRQKLFVSPRRQSCELLLRRADRSTFKCRIESLVEASGRNESARCLLALSDVSEQAMAEEALRRSEEHHRSLNVHLEQRVIERTAALTEANGRLQAIMDAALDAVVTFNARGTIDSLNPAALLLFAYAVGELDGCNIRQLIVPPEDMTGAEPIAASSQIGDTRLLAGKREALGRKKAGEVFLIELSIGEFSDKGERKFVAMLRDVTACKKRERELLEVSERERLRIGRDLHDGLGQHLHGCFYLSSLMERGLQKDVPPSVEDIRQLNRYLGEALKLTRSLAHGLQAVKPVPNGLMAALDCLADLTRKLYGVRCRFVCPRPVPLPQHAAATHLYRIAQEAVTNAMKHAGPTYVRIELSANKLRIRLRIWDNGEGIRRRGGTVGGMGLHVMHWRAEAIGGTLAIRTPPRGGTEIACVTPHQALLALKD
jgi:PAS domain S-box-containing protein